MNKLEDLYRLKIEYFCNYLEDLWTWYGVRYKSAGAGKVICRIFETEVWG